MLSRTGRVSQFSSGLVGRFHETSTQDIHGFGDTDSFRSDTLGNGIRRNRSDRLAHVGGERRRTALPDSWTWPSSNPSARLYANLAHVATDYSTAGRKIYRDRAR